MDISIAAGGPIKAPTLKDPITGRQGATFPRLRMKDLAELQACVPGDSRFVTIFDLSRFAQTPDGAREVLLLSLRQRDDALRDDAIRDYGSVLQRVEIARLLMGESLTTGEDELMQEEAEGGGESRGSGGKSRGQGTGPKSQS